MDLLKLNWCVNYLGGIIVYNLGRIILEYVGEVIEYYFDGIVVKYLGRIIVNILVGLL